MAIFVRLNSDRSGNCKGFRYWCLPFAHLARQCDKQLDCYYLMLEFDTFLLTSVG